MEKQDPTILNSDSFFFLCLFLIFIESYSNFKQ